MTGAAAILIAQIQILTLADALSTAAAHQPQIRLARANSDVARARVGEARAAILPQLQGTAIYQRTTANFTQRPRPPAQPDQQRRKQHRWKATPRSTSSTSA